MSEQAPDNHKTDLPAQVLGDTRFRVPDRLRKATSCALIAIGALTGVACNFSPQRTPQGTGTVEPYVSPLIGGSVEPDNGVNEASIIAQAKAAASGSPAAPLDPSPHSPTGGNQTIETSSQPNNHRPPGTDTRYEDSLDKERPSLLTELREYAARKRAAQNAAKPYLSAAADEPRQDAKTDKPASTPQEEIESPGMKASRILSGEN